MVSPGFGWWVSGFGEALVRTASVSERTSSPETRNPEPRTGLLRGLELVEDQRRGRVEERRVDVRIFLGRVAGPVGRVQRQPVVELHQRDVRQLRQPDLHRLDEQLG